MSASKMIKLASYLTLSLGLASSQIFSMETQKLLPENYSSLGALKKKLAMSSAKKQLQSRAKKGDPLAKKAITQSPKDLKKAVQIYEELIGKPLEEQSAAALSPGAHTQESPKSSESKSGESRESSDDGTPPQPAVSPMMKRVKPEETRLPEPRHEDVKPLEARHDRDEALRQEELQDEHEYEVLRAALHAAPPQANTLGALLLLEDRALFTTQFANLLRSPRVVEMIREEHNVAVLRSVRHMARKFERLGWATKSSETSDLIAIINAVDLKLGKTSFGYKNRSE